MDINAGIIDQHVRGIADAYAADLSGDADKRRSTAFIVLCAKTLLELDQEEAMEALTEGGNDADVDALTIGDLQDGEFVVTLVQGKYKRRLDGESAFPANAIKKIIGTIGAIFDPYKNVAMNSLLAAKVTEVRGLILDGNLPIVRVLLCNNGKRWNDDGQLLIGEAGFPSARVKWEHVNHDRLVALMRSRQKVGETIQCQGKALVEDFDHRRVFVGKVPVSEVQRIFGAHGDVLLERNIRRYLGLRDNRVNLGIHQTLMDEGKRPNFYFYNNGLTAVCSKFTHNALQQVNYQVRAENLQIINGGQTCKTIQRTLDENPEEDFGTVFVLLRLYELPDGDDELVSTITYATNSQNPVDLGDLRSNDVVQQTLTLGVKELGFEYKTKRDTATTASSTITISVAAEAVMATWRRKPHAAKFRRRRLFGDLYGEIFSKHLNASQVVIAVLLFRVVENERKRPTVDNPPVFLPYASHFLSMVLSEVLLDELGLSSHDEIDHRNFAEVRAFLDENRTGLYSAAVSRLDAAIDDLGIAKDESLPRLAATFRRGDLLETLAKAREAAAE